MSTLSPVRPRSSRRVSRSRGSIVTLALFGALAACGPLGDEPSIDSAKQSGAPSIDSAKQSGAPSIDSAKQSGAPSIESRRSAVSVAIGNQLALDTWQSNLKTGDRISMVPLYYRHCVDTQTGPVTTFNPSRCWDIDNANFTAYTGSTLGPTAPQGRLTTGDLLTVEVINPTAELQGDLDVRLKAPSGNYLRLRDPNYVNYSPISTIETPDQAAASVFNIRQGNAYGIYGPAEVGTLRVRVPGTTATFGCGAIDITAQGYSMPMTLVCGVDFRGNYITPLARFYVAPTAPSINLALLRQTSQSSTYNSDGPSWKAVDGNANGDWGYRSTSHTDFQHQPSWQVDLGASVSIGRIQINNRTDCCSDRLANYFLRYSNDNRVWSGFQTSGVAPASQSFQINQTARYVQVQLPISNALSLAEVQIYPELEDLALGKSTRQSTTAWGGVPDRAVDGNIDGTWANGSVTHTDAGPGQWWRVDLGSPRYVDHVLIYNRQDCCGGRLGNATVHLSLDDEAYVAAGVANAVGSAARVAVGQTARYVRISHDNSEPLSLAEVVVLGY